METTALVRTTSVNLEERRKKPCFIKKWKSLRSWTNSIKYAELDEPSSDVPSDEIEVDLRVKIHKDRIRNSFIAHTRASYTDTKVLLGIENREHVSLEELKRLDPNVLLLWACFTKRGDLLSDLHEVGWNINFICPLEGFTPLHLAAFSGCVKSLKWLVNEGCNLEILTNNFSPLHYAVFGNSPEAVIILIGAGCIVHNTTLHYAVRTNAVECLRILLSKNVDVNSLDLCGFSPLHLAADTGNVAIMEMLLSSENVDVNLLSRDTGYTALHFAAEGGHSAAIKMLLQNKANVSIRNKKGQIPLHLGSRSQSAECIKILLKAGSDVCAQDDEKRTPLHTAVGQALLAYRTVDTLIKGGADVNIKDKYGYTALHIAAVNELTNCVDLLIMNGGDVSARTKGGLTALGIVRRKTPSCLSAIKKKLDSSISIHDPEQPYNEIELRLDFRCLLQHSTEGEVKLLRTLIDEGEKIILDHPLCCAFLHLKWRKIRRFYFSRLCLSSVFVMLLTTYVMTALAHNCYNAANNKTDSDLCINYSVVGKFLLADSFIIEVIWYLLVTFAILEIIRKLCAIAGYCSATHYFGQWVNVIEWYTIISVFAISFVYTGRTYLWQNSIGAFGVLCGWANLMLIIGQLPVFGTYVEMFTKVQAEFFKLFLLFSCLLIGFTINFCVIFPTSKAFQSPVIGFINVLIMMSGNLDIDFLMNQKSNYPLINISVYLTYISFIIFVTVVLMNLLVGAFNDIQGLYKIAGLSKLVRQTDLISFVELTLFRGYLPNQIVKILRPSALLSPDAYRYVVHVKPLNPREKCLPPDILSAAHEIARQNRASASYRSTSDGRPNSEHLFKKIEKLESMLGRQQLLMDELLNKLNL